MRTDLNRKGRPKLLFIVNTAHFFISHRLPLAVAALKKGFDVHIAAPGTQDEGQLVVEAGCDFHPLPFERGNAGFMAEACTFARIALLVARTQPNVLHAVTIKPVIYGGTRREVAWGGRGPLRHYRATIPGSLCDGVQEFGK